MLRKRLRFIAWMVALVTSTFTILGYVTDGPATPATYLVIAVDVGIAVLAIFLAGRLGTFNALVALSLAVIGGIYVGCAGWAILEDDVGTTALAFCALSAVMAAMMPWTVTAQVAVVIVGTLALTANVLGVPPEVSAGLSPAAITAIAATGLGSIYLSMQLEAQRMDTARDHIELDHAQSSLERRVAERTAELEALNRDLHTFSLSISHDLRAPLRAMAGFSQALRDDFGSRLEPNAVEWLDRMREASKRLDQRIDDLLRLVRVTRGQLHVERIDLATIAHELAQELGERYPERAVELVVGDGLQAEGDPVLLRIALAHLMANAWKYTQTAAPARIEVGVSNGAAGSVYFVRDNGVGFAMEDAERVFEAFTRVHAGSAHDGTGMGLAAVKRIFERHGGRVWAESRPGQGATFYFMLRESA